MLERLKEFEAASIGESVKNNPPVLKMTRVAQTIDRLPHISKQNSCISEATSGYSFEIKKETTQFMIKHGLWYSGKK